MIKFCHIADCHLGVWNHHPELAGYPEKALQKAVDACIEERVNFVIIAGDFLDTSMPSIETLKAAAVQLSRLKNNDIPVYVVAGSHDYSPSGKTMLSVFSASGLMQNVFKPDWHENKLRLAPTIDKSGTLLIGLPGRTASLEKEYYDNLDKEHLKEILEKNNGLKIFVMHSAISEFKPDFLKNMASIPISSIPGGFDYYANGHVHVNKIFDIGSGKMAFPGPLFSSSFKELEDSNGSFLINAYSVKITCEIKNLDFFNVKKIKIDASDKSIESVENEIELQLKQENFSNTLVLLEIRGILKSGKPSDLNISKIKSLAYGAVAFKVNTNRLETKTMKEIKVIADKENIEDIVIKEHATGSIENEKQIIVSSFKFQ